MRMLDHLFDRVWCQRYPFTAGRDHGIDLRQSAIARFAIQVRSWPAADLPRARIRPPPIASGADLPSRGCQTVYDRQEIVALLMLGALLHRPTCEVHA